MSALAVALTGNPNTGKSTIFNALTGAKQKVGNWPGITVDKKVGYINYKDRAISVVDLPGTYSINARSAEEKIVIDYLREADLDLVMDVVDSANLERNLFLAVQLLEQGVPLLIDLNMKDEAAKRGIIINVAELEKAIGMPVVETIGRKSRQILLDTFTNTVMSRYKPSDMVCEHIEKVNALRHSGQPAADIEEAIITARYDLIDKIVAAAVTVEHVGASSSEKIDNVVANGMLALPILLAMLYMVFQITFKWIGQPLSDALGDFIGGPFTDWVSEGLEALAVQPWMQSLIVDGIINGMGSVITFVPLIFVLFFCLSFLDGTGYMARVAFIMDPIMRRVGLTGKGVMPLIMGFGCAVPAIMGARALDSEKDRLISLLVTPFLTCGAKLPIMALFAAMFFPENAANIVFLMYIIGIVMAIAAAKLLGSTIFKEHGSTFLLELPPYRVPDMKSVLLETWEKGKGYLVKAGTIIFAGCVLIWFLSNYNLNGMAEEMNESFLAAIGSAISYIFVFQGFDTWEAGAAVISGILAKESVVSTIGILYGVGEVSTEAAETAEAAEMLMDSGMATAFTSLSALSFMVFSQLYTPCVTALGTIKKEAGGWRWLIFSAFYMFAIAWLASLAVYQIGRLFL